MMFALIPAALAGAGLMWLAFYTGVIDWSKAQRVEARMDNRVGVNGQLTKPVELIIRTPDCFRVSRAYLDGQQLTVYLHNGCHEQIGYYEWHYNEVSPDGTIIHSWYDNDASGREAEGTWEITRGIEEDSRMAKVVVWATHR